MGRNLSVSKSKPNGNQQKRENKNVIHKKITNAQPKKSDMEMSNLIYPNGDTAFKAILLARFGSAIWLHITDCDETYNYWEPTHYLLFGKGYQTWEYSPEFALRSYTYLLIHAVPAKIYQKLFNPNPLLIFYFIRCLLGLLCSFVEVYFYKAVCREFGVHVGRMCLAFQLFSAGMFISSTAFLPSSWAMYMLCIACAAWWTQKYEFAIFATALGSLLGWPFAALLGIPMAVDMLFVKKLYRTFVQWSVMSAGVIIAPMVFIDSMHFGKIVIAPWNIVKYNIFGGAGPNLYGTEPFSFYLVNGFLNFNFIWVLSLSTPIALILSHYIVPSNNKSTLTLPHYLSLSPLFLWLVVFLMQPHKEERFLFPIYPLICLCGSITLDIVQKLFFRVWSYIKTIPYGTHYLDMTSFIMIGTIVITSLISVSRMYALYTNYHAPLDIFMELNRYPAEGMVSETVSINVCLGKDWHRFPNSFFLPSTNWNVRLIKSEFDGMLPAPYSQTENGTKLVHSYFNDQNKEEPSLYFDIAKCHFLIDLNVGKESALEPIYANRRDNWRVMRSIQFLNAEKSHIFFRAFYIPFVSHRYIKYGNLSLLQTIKQIKIK